MPSAPVVIDSHAYCFTAPDTPAGHASAQDHLDLWQRQYALHHQPAFRVRNRAPADSRLLLDPTPNDPGRLARNRAFRVDRVHRRLVWTVDGEDCTKQQLPPNVIEFSAGDLLAEMDHAGVDCALLHADATLTRDTAFLAACVAAAPDRLRAMAPLDEWLIPTRPGEAIAQARAAVEQHRLHALKVIPAYAYQHGHRQSFADPSWHPFWAAVERLGVPVFLTLGSRPGIADPRQAFIAELWELRRLLDRLPALRTSITHGYPWRDFLVGDHFELPDEMWAPLRGTNVLLEVGFPYRIGDRLEYPYRACWPVIEAMVQHLGASRLMWGSDMPFQNRFCTYRQSRDYIERRSLPFLSPADLSLIMGGTAAALLGFERTD
jgi:predicted TIM-barrel fold metal-dependent hydrolase